jgi:hypothetical protein
MDFLVFKEGIEGKKVKTTTNKIKTAMGKIKIV